MNIDQATSICFSPTGTTRKIIESIMAGLQLSLVRKIDLTLPAAKTREFVIPQDDFAIIGAPVSAGWIPATAARRLKQIRTDNTPAVIVVVYGNRAFEDALLELSELVKVTGFIPVAMRISILRNY